MSSCGLLKVFFPLAPGIDSIWEPFQEEVQARVQEVQQQFDDVMDGMHLCDENIFYMDKYVPSCITFTAVRRMEHALWMHINAPCSCTTQAAV